LINRVSILIPTRNRASSLKRLLASLQFSTCLDDTQVEVIVINNQPRDPTVLELIEALAEQMRFPIRVLEQSKRGKSWALNLGLGQATGSVLLLLDDDVVVDQSCVGEHVAAYKQNVFDAVQGKVLPGRDPEGQPADISRLAEYNSITSPLSIMAMRLVGFAALPVPIFPSSGRFLKRSACLILGSALAPPGSVKTPNTRGAFARSDSK
jgi:glycosyltransferase involved in cell wall biosynthesis